jgi:hypothetical protein
MNIALQRTLLLLCALAVLVIAFPIPFGLALLSVVILAVLLIAVLTMRGRSWHRSGVHALDPVLIATIGAAVVYVSLFFAFQYNWLSVTASFLFAALFIVFATTIGPVERAQPVAHATHAHMHASRRHSPKVVTSKVTQPAVPRDPVAASAPRGPFKRIRTALRERKVRRQERRAKRAEEEALGLRKKSFLRRLFRRGMEPLKEIRPIEPGKRHDADFHEGVEPLQPLRAMAPGNEDATRPMELETYTLSQRSPKAGATPVRKPRKK